MVKARAPGRSQTGASRGRTDMSCQVSGDQDTFPGDTELSGDRAGLLSPACDFNRETVRSGPVRTLYEEQAQLCHQKTNNPFQKGQRLNESFLQRDVQMANGHMKRRSTLFVTTETQIRAE